MFYSFFTWFSSFLLSLFGFSSCLWMMLPVATRQPSLDPLGSPLFLLFLFFSSSSGRFWFLLYSPAVTAPTLSSQPGFSFSVQNTTKASWADEAHHPPYCFSADSTFDHPSICELSCLYNCHFKSLSQIGVWSRDKSSSGCIRMVILSKPVKTILPSWVPHVLKSG